MDCANCANKMEEAANKTAGVKNAVVNFLTLKMNVEFEEGAAPKEVMQEVLKNCKKVEDDCEIFLLEIVNDRWVLIAHLLYIIRLNIVN